MEIIVIVCCLATISFSFITMHKFRVLEDKIFSKEDIETMTIKNLTKVFDTVYKENKNLKSANSELLEKNEELKVKLEKITKQIESFTKVFK